MFHLNWVKIGIALLLSSRLICPTLSPLKMKVLKRSRKKIPQVA